MQKINRWEFPFSAKIFLHSSYMGKRVAMAKQENFTAKVVNGFQCKAGKQQSIYWDGKTPGLGLRVTVGGCLLYTSRCV